MVFYLVISQDGGEKDERQEYGAETPTLEFLLYAFALIFSIVATGWVKVENDITTYLPEDTETRQGLTVMNDNFVTYGTA